MSRSRRFGPERATPPPRAFGALLRQHRILADLTQEALAERAGLSERAISDLERGVSRTPQSSTVDLLAEALQLSAEERDTFAAAARREKLQEQPDPTPLVPVSVTTRHDGQENAPPPRRDGPLPARRPRAYIVVGLLALLVVAASSGVGYWLKLGPFGKGAAASATSASGYVYAQPTHTGGTITFSRLGFPDTTNPWFSGFNVQDVGDALWGNPFVTSPSATLLPDELTEVPTLANGDISQDGLTLTMRLRPDLKWSDGQPITADDFAYWLEVFQDSASGSTETCCYEFGYQSIASYQVQNAQTLVLHYKKPFAFALLFLPWAALRHAWGSIPHKDLASRDEVNLYPAVTSGPFTLESDVPGKSMTLVPNKYFRSSTLHRSVLKKLIYTTYPDVDSLIAAFLAGQTDYAEGFDVEQGDLLKVSGVPGYRTAPGLGYQRLNFNLSQPALQDYQVRKAIEEAIDRCGLIQQVFQQPCANMLLDTIMPPPLPDYDPIIKTYGYDLAQARQDMLIAGWNCSSGTCTKDGQPFPTLSLAIRKDKIARVQASAFVKQSLEKLGIPVLLSYYPPDVLFNDYTSGGILATGQYDLAIWGDYYDLDDDFTFGTYFASSQIPSASNPLDQNVSRVNDPLIDEDVAEARVTLDTAARTEIYKALEQDLVQKVYVVPLYLGPDLALVKPNIGNYQDNALYQGNEWNIGDWFLTQ